MTGAGVTIVDPTRPGGFGDDAMCLGLADGLADLGVEDFLVLSQRRPMRHLCTVAPVGTQLRARALRCPLRGWQLAAHEVSWRLPHEHDRCVLVGADLLDGHYGPHLTAFYCRTANRLAARGVAVSVAGSSFTRASDESLQHLRGLDPAVRLCIRDPDSLARLRAVGGPAAIEVRDVAFLLRAEAGPQRKAIDAFVAAQHAGGRTVVGLNVNALTVADYRAFFGPLLAAMAEDPIAWLVVGHDTRPGVDDFASGHQVAAMAREMGIPVHALERGTDVREIKYTVGACDAVLTGRMHLSIAALGMGVPVVGLSYLDKFAGLFTQVGLADYLQDTATATPDSVAVALRALLGDRAGHGVGTFVTDDGREQLAEALALSVRRGDYSPWELYIVRRGLELIVVEQAVEKATPEQIIHMRQALDDYHQQLQSRGSVGQADKHARFHHLMLRSTGNRILMDLLDPLTVFHIPPILGTEGVVKTDITAYIQEHRQIIDAIEQRDPEAAKAAMVVHLKPLKERARRATAAMQCAEKS